jgi:riboflavin kinase/FMN adenylyltransferase
VGHRPTFGGQTVSVETHILDFEGDLYDTLLRVEFVARLRGEARFGSIEELTAQIGRDVAEARRVLSSQGT